MATTPSHGAVNVDPAKPITILFAEWVDEKSVREGITVFPTMADKPEIIIRGKTVRITPRGTFQESTTYHIELTSTIKDLHGNNISTPVQLVFSSGPVLDSGYVSGCIARAAALKIQPRVSLFSLDSIHKDDSSWFGLPSYQVQTDSSGAFRFSHIKKAAYRLIAFSDANNDQLLQPGREQLFMPDCEIIDPRTDSTRLFLFASTCDTSPLAVTAVEAETPTRIRVTCSRTDTSFERAWKSWRIEPIDTTRPSFGVDTCLRLHNSALLLLVPTQPLSPGGYRLLSTRVPLYRASALHDTLLWDTLRFNGTAPLDTIAPQVNYWVPRGYTDLRPEIRVLFSEPVKGPINSLYVRDTLGDTVPLSGEQRLSDTLVFTPQRQLTPGTEYWFEFSPEDVYDLAGNRLEHSDSTDTLLRFAFTTLHADSLCISLSGKTDCLGPGPRRIWTCSPLRSSRSYYTPDSLGMFSFDSIPGGLVTLAWFTDIDTNGRPGSGSLFPFRLPEPWFALPDTVEARPRWKIDGLVLRACDFCQTPAASPVNSVSDSLKSPAE